MGIFVPLGIELLFSSELPHRPSSCTLALASMMIPWPCVGTAAAMVGITLLQYSPGHITHSVRQGPFYVSLLRGKNNVERQRYEQALPPTLPATQLGCLLLRTEGAAFCLAPRGFYAGPDLQLGLAYNGYLIIAVDTACAGLNTWLPRHLSTSKRGRDPG